MTGHKRFFAYVIPSVLAFALSGVYAIVDGYFIGNRIGDVGLSAMNIAYPITSLIQAVGTGIGMGGAVYFSITRAEKKEKESRNFIAGALWLLLLSSLIVTVLFSLLTVPILRLLGADGVILSLGRDYIFVIALGAGLQIIGTGFVPFIRNNGSSFFAMLSMVMGFVTNIILDYLFVWVYDWSTRGAALATVIGQGITMSAALVYLIRKGQITFKIPPAQIGRVVRAIVKIGFAPFALALTPNITLVIINRFSIYYGGEEAIAVYACMSYVISIVYLVLQGVGDGSQPLMSQYYGEGNRKQLQITRSFTYHVALVLSAVSIVVLYAARWQIGTLLGASETVIHEVAAIAPVFLFAIPAVAINRITTASFYATEKSAFSYILAGIEPFSMLILMLLLPPLFGGQIMIWWSTALARVFSAVLALIFKYRADKQEKTVEINA